MTKSVDAAPEPSASHKPRAKSSAGAPLVNVTWMTKRIKVRDLREYDRNPRVVSERAYKRLKKSIRTLGYHELILAQPDLSIVSGHVRKRVLMELGFEEIDVRVPDRELTEEEFKQALIQSNTHAGRWDHDILANDFEIEDLAEWGLPVTLDGGDDADDLSEGQPEPVAAADHTVCPACGQPVPQPDADEET